MTTLLVGSLPVQTAAEDHFYDEVGIGHGETVGDGFGASLATGDIDGSGLVDVLVGAPDRDSGGKGSGAVYVFLDLEDGALGEGITVLDPSRADAVLVGGPGDRMGSALAVIGDVDGDGAEDLAVGAEGHSNGRGRVQVLSGGSLVKSPAASLLFSVDGAVPGGGLGHSLTACGDLDGDSIPDLVAGAPGEDAAHVIFGDGTPLDHDLDLWAWSPLEGQPVSFSGGVNNTPFDTSTFGIPQDPSGGDDGWDWTDGAYGWVEVDSGMGPVPDGAHEYSAPEPGGPDADGLTADGSSRLEVQVGPSHGSPGPSGSPGGLYSGAWGIQVWLSGGAWSSIENGSKAVIGFSWEAQDLDRTGSDDAAYVKARFGKAGVRTYLGKQLGGDATADVFYIARSQSDPTWGPISSEFSQDVTALLSGPGWYYLDFGAVYDARGGNQRSNEGLRVYFDNVTLKVVGTAFSLTGPRGSSFGASVLSVVDRDGDGKTDIAVGAPGLAPGGGLFVFNGPFGRGGGRAWNASMERYMALPAGMGLGEDITSLPMDMDGDSDLQVGAPGQDEVVVLPTAWEGLNDWWPDLGDLDGDGLVDFDEGIVTTGDTWGHGGVDDGWDMAPTGIYGGVSQQVRYNPGPNESADGTDRRAEKVQELQIELGGGNHGEKPVTPASGAYGIEFNIPQDASIRRVFLRFEWAVTDVHGIRSGSEEVWVKARLGKASSMNFLGTSLDDGSDGVPEIGYSHDFEAPGQIFLGGEAFEVDVSDIVTGPGSYYLELGGKVKGWGMPEEYVVISFDDVTLEIGTDLLTLTGPADSRLGEDLAVVDIDGKGGSDLCALEGSTGGLVCWNAGSLMGAVKDGWYEVAPDGRYDIKGYEPGDATVMGAATTGTGFPRGGALVGVPAAGGGMVVLVKRFVVPEVVWLSPQDGEGLYGTVELAITVNGEGPGPEGMEATFSCADVLGGWYNLGPGAISEDGFTHPWDTTQFANGVYRLQAEVTNAHGIVGMSEIEIGVTNLHSPSGAILSPEDGATIRGTVAVSVAVEDLDMDLVDIDLYRSEGETAPAAGEDWTLVGSLEPDGGSLQIGSIPWPTIDLADGGPHWLALGLADAHGQGYWSVAGPFWITNPRGPVVRLVSPVDGETLSGDTLLQATASDEEGDIDLRGVRFQFTTGTEDGGPWLAVGNDASPDGDLYSIVWTPDLQDGAVARVRAIATDCTGLEGMDEVTVSYMVLDAGEVHLDIMRPTMGETLAGIAVLEAKVSASPDVVLETDICFRVRAVDAGNWVPVTCGRPDGNGTVLLPWDTSELWNGLYEAFAVMEVTADLSIASPIVRFQLGNPGDGPSPITVEVRSPSIGDVIRGGVRVEVVLTAPAGTDLVERIASVEVSYSRDMLDFLPLGQVSKISVTETDGAGMAVEAVVELDWNVTGLENGYVYLMAKATDIDGGMHPSRPYGPVEVRSVPEPVVDGDGPPPSYASHGSTFLFGVFISALVGIGLGLGVDATKYPMIKYLTVSFFPLYSKLKKERMLDHILRSRIFRYICENPGENFSSIRRNMRLTNGVFSYHLWTLEREGFVVSRIDGRYRRFYPMSGVKPPKDIDGLNWFQLGILDVVSKHDGLSLMELSKELGESPQVVGYHLKLMTLAGIIRKERSGKKVRHFLGVEEKDIEDIRI